MAERVAHTAPLEQRLTPRFPSPEMIGMTTSFGDVEISSPNYSALGVSLPFEEGLLSVQFNEVRAFFTSWDGDQHPFLTAEEAASRAADLLMVQDSRWLASDQFSLDIPSGPAASQPFAHFVIIASERSVHIAARDSYAATWQAGRWSGGPGEWKFTPIGD